MTGHGAKFGRKKEAAIAALLSQRTVEEAARVAGISAKTLSRWLKAPEFKEEYRLARMEAMSETMARLQQAAAPAVLTLVKVMINADSPASSRVRAAQCILELGRKAQEAQDLEARIVQLEKKVA